MSQISEARQDSLFELARERLACRGKPGCSRTVPAVSSAILAVRTKESVSKFPLRRPSQYGVPLFAGFFHSFFYHTDDMVVSQIEAGAEVILRAYFAEGIFHGYVARPWPLPSRHSFTALYKPPILLWFSAVTRTPVRAA